jgi:acid stress-induced BolA-like protein IbaG/YrbA
MSDPTPEEVRSFIAAGLNCQTLEVEGDGRHFFATIVSSEFEGLPRVRRHQRVYNALGDRMREQIHALSMKTLTPAEHGPAADAPAQPAAGAGTSNRSPY